MPVYERHVFVCKNTRPDGDHRGCCLSRGAGSIRDRLRQLVDERGLKRKIRINTADCLGQCEHGPVLVVYPEGVWYGFVQLEDVEEIFESHLIGGRPVKRLQLPSRCVNTPHCPHKREIVRAST